MYFIYVIYFIIFPFNLTFVHGSFWQYPYCIEYGVLWLFWIDIIFNFCVGFRDSKTKEIILDRRYLTWQYLRTYFLFDVLSSMPYSPLFHILKGTRNDGLPNIIALFGFFKFVRLQTVLECRQSLIQVSATARSLVQFSDPTTQIAD